MDEISGEAGWYRNQADSMKSRAPLPDAEYLAMVGSDQADAPKWVAVRDAVAESIGMPSEAVSPEDSMRDLWRMQWLGRDLLDTVFRLEMKLNTKISTQEFPKYRRSWEEIQTFADFAWVMVQLIKENETG